MSQEIENQEYHFIITHKDLSSSFFIAPNYDIYMNSIEVLKKEKTLLISLSLKANRFLIPIPISIFKTIVS